MLWYEIGIKTFAPVHWSSKQLKQNKYEPHMIKYGNILLSKSIGALNESSNKRGLYGYALFL